MEYKHQNIVELVIYPLNLQLNLILAMNMPLSLLKDLFKVTPSCSFMFNPCAYLLKPVPTKTWAKAFKLAAEARRPATNEIVK